MRTVLSLVLLAACGSTGAAIPYYDPDGGLMDAPWPTDDRVTADGLDITGFPNPDNVPLLTVYTEAASALPGWGTASPMYIPFAVPPDASVLPNPSESRVNQSGVLLVNVDPDSDGYGELIPIQWELLGATRFTLHDQLAVSPLVGLPLRPATTYALLVTTEIATPDPTFVDRFKSDDVFVPLDEALKDIGIKRRDIAVATVFTTRHPLEEMDRMVQGVRALPAPSLSQALTEVDSNVFYRSFDGVVDAPLWQHGEIPYEEVGGGFRFDDAGAPIVAETVSLRLRVSTPLDLSAPPDGGFPVVLYAHGTGGDYSTFADSSGGLEPASLMAREGMVGIGFDQPLHGPRGNDVTNVDFHSFNYLNPTSARANFRQGSLDIVWLIHGLRTGQVQFTTDGGEVIPINSDNVLFEGHSQGGLTGGIALPWLGDDLKGAVLSGAGGGLSITMVKRKNPLDISALVGTLVGLDDGDTLTPLHPVVGMVQLIAEETDPLNYAPYYFHRDGGYSTSTTPVLLTSGQFDEQTDHETAEALAVAARMPPISPVWNRTSAMDLLELNNVPSPATDTVTGFDGQPLTAGFSQWEEGDHFVIFDDRNAGLMVQRFLRGAADSNAVINTRP
ncbi:MAG: hypothetical protein AB8H79_04605 [Myxococcota bacterium]